MKRGTISYSDWLESIESMQRRFVNVYYICESENGVFVALADCLLASVRLVCAGNRGSVLDKLKLTVSEEL